jgi:hypothetical protein
MHPKGLPLRIHDSTAIDIAEQQKGKKGCSKFLIKCVWIGRCQPFNVPVEEKCLDTNLISYINPASAG